MNYYEPIRYVVTAEEAGWTLRTVLRSRLQCSRKLISRLKLTEQGILVNQERQYTNYKVQVGDTIELRMEEEVSEDILPQNLPLDVVYEDAYLLLVNKPAGMIVHPTHGHYTNTLANAVVYYWQQCGVRVRFRPVHRLDQDTSGLLAIAKNPYIHQQLSEQLQRFEVEKTYLALVHGVIARDAGTINAPIDRNPEEPHLRTVTATGYPAITHYYVERRFAAATLVKLQLETGRTHQIRVHMQYLGHPLLGDDLYGDRTKDEQLRSSGFARQALHARSLGFTHPMTRQRMRHEADLPEDMRHWLAELESSIR